MRKLSSSRHIICDEMSQYREIAKEKSYHDGLN